MTLISTAAILDLSNMAPSLAPNWVLLGRFEHVRGKYGLSPLSARALVKKSQKPGIKLQKADFFRNDTWTSPQTNSEEAPKIPLVHFS